MAQIKAQLNYLRISPRKVRLLAELIRGKSLRAAERELEFSTKTSAIPLQKLLKSAKANAKHSFDIDSDKLMVKEIRVDEGPTLKRFMPRAHGRATPIRKRTSCVTLILSDIK